MELNFTNTGLVLRRTALETESKIKPLTGVYDEFQKLVFMFDCSGSMASLIARSYEDQYSWTPENMADIRAKAEAAFAAKAAVEAIQDEDIRCTEMMLLGPEVFELASWCDDTGKAKPDLELQQAVIRTSKFSDFSVQVNWEKHTGVPPTRIDVVKKLAHSELAKRVAKYPKGKLAVIRFGSEAQILYEEGHDEAQLWAAVDGLNTNDGGTDILQALAAGMETCRKSPSKVGIHHFVLVTDGEWWGNLDSWLPTLKASGVVLDYIHIGDLQPNEDIARACKETGGEYALVNSEKSLREKFVEAVSRKMLPASSK